MNTLSPSVATKTQQQIISNIQNWLKATKDLSQLLTLFTPKSGFILNLNENFMPWGNQTNDDDIHVYPAINETGELLMYLIYDKYDQPGIQWENHIVSFYVTDVDLPRESVGPVNGKIPRQIAFSRIMCWQDQYQIWLEHAVSNELVFQAFFLPASDVKAGVKNVTYFALESASSLDDLSAELITDNLEKQSSGGTFYDTVRPVPPFKPMEREKLYLLDLAHQSNETL